MDECLPAWSDRRLGSTARPRHCTMCFLARAVRDLVRSLDGTGSATAPQRHHCITALFGPQPNPFRASKDSSRQPSAGNERADGGRLFCVDSWLAWGWGVQSTNRRIDGGNARVSARSACVRGTACAHWPHPMHLAFDHRSFIGARLVCACPLSSRSQAVVALRPPLIRSRPQIRRRHAARLILARPL